MGELIILLVAVLVFYLLWTAIGLVPEPKPASENAKPLPLRWVLYLLLIVVSVFWLVTRFGLA